MTNNDILRRLRYVFDFKDSEIVEIFALADKQVKRTDVSNWLKPDEDLAFQKCDDIILAIFLNGLIVQKRGKKDGPPSEPEKVLNNNIIFMKLKIALNLKAEEVLEILNLVDFDLSKHELSALFRNKEHVHYRECQDQLLRNFLNGVQVKYRDGGRVGEE